MPENGNAVDWFLDRHVRDGQGDRIAFTDPSRTMTYGDLARQTARFASAVEAAGIKREQRIILAMLDTIDFPVAFWGALRAGVVPVPINTLLTADTMEYIVRDSRAAAVVVSEALRDGVPTVPGVDAISDMASFLATGREGKPTAETSPDEVAFWLYSSGSTGAPKGVRHVHASLRFTAETYGMQVLGIRPDDVMFSAAKAFHAYGLGNAMTFPMSVGASTVFLPGRPTPDAVLEIMRQHRPTIFGGVPTLYAGLLANPLTGPGAGSDRLRRCISAGEALPADIGHRWKSMVGTDILDGIGSTEMLHIFISNRPDDIRYGTSGKPVPGYEAVVLNEHGRPVPNGEAGELVVKGVSAADGYWNLRGKTRSTFRGEWTHTGDTYIRDADGYYRYQGRSDEMLKVSGIWVSPFEVEEALISHSAVLEAAVVGHEDRDGLTKPRAFVILRDDDTDRDALAETLKTHVKDRIGVWKYPRWIEFVDSLPKTATGKIQRFRLRMP